MVNFKSLVALSSAAFFMVVATPSMTMAAENLEIRNFVGTINWSNGPLSVDVTKNAGETKVSGRRSIVIDGGQNDIDGSDCKSSYGRYNIDWFGKKKEGRFGGYDKLEDFPVLEISIPESTKVSIKNAIVFTDGAPNIQAADLELRHCGEVTLGHVDGVLALDSRGSADVTLGDSGQIAAVLKGSGDLSGANSREVLIRSHGSGDVDLENIVSLEASTHGSGDLTIGDVDGKLFYSGFGSGDLTVASIEGDRLELQSQGPGDVDIGAGQVDVLTATVRGSATIEFSGDAETAKLRSSGSGDIYVNRVTGVAEIKTSGSGDIEIDERD